MNIYGKLIVLGIIGLITVGIFLGVATPPPPGAELTLDGAFLDIFILWFILGIKDDTVRTFLLLLWLFGFFTTTSEE